jgi:hypothetical protein
MKIAAPRLVAALPSFRRLQRAAGRLAHSDGFELWHGRGPRGMLYAPH